MDLLTRVWLHRQGDLIIETPIDSDEKVMSTCPGHGYLLREGHLTRVQIAQCCTCGLPETHDQRVFSVLQISRLVREGKLLFLPHAHLSELGWFVVLGPNESQLIQPSVDSFHKIMKALQQQLDQKPGDLDSEERNYLDRLRRESAVAFQNAIPLSSDDDRWASVDGMVKDVMAVDRMADELPAGEVNGQLVLYIPEHSGINSLPSRAILYVWPTVFGLITTFSFYWSEKDSTRGMRAYLDSADTKIDCAKSKKTLFAFVASDSRRMDRLIEVDLRPIANLSAPPTEKVQSVQDFPAARLWAMNNLNKPSAQSPTEDWLRHGYISRVTKEVREAIQCIEENSLQETIPDEARRMEEQGLQGCYKIFPYQEDVYRLCRAKLAEPHDHFLRPFFELSEIYKRAEAPRLGYQLQQLLTSALYSVELTRAGTCIPSYDSDGNWDIVEIDVARLGYKAKVFWENLPWTVIHYCREIIGPGGIPANIDTFYEAVPGWEGDIEEGKTAIKRLMNEALAEKSASIQPGIYVSILGGGILVGVRLKEIANDVVATFYDSLGGFVQVSIGFEGDSWNLHTHATRSVKAKFRERLKVSGAFEGLTEVERIREYDERFDVWIQRIKLGVAASLAAIIHDFWLADRCAPRFLENGAVGNTGTIGVATELPRARYITGIDQLRGSTTQSDMRA